MKKTILLFAGLAFLAYKNQAQTVSDFDGNVYNTVTIGTQVWMRENLKATHYSSGVPMIDGTSAGNIGGNYTAKYYFDHDNIPANTVIYGKLYTWAAVMNGANSSNSQPSGVQGPCPTGWHVPSDAEWNIMAKYLDIYVDTTSELYSGLNIGNKLKESGTSHWSSGNCGDNSSNFTALPGGCRFSDASFSNIHDGGYWWTSTTYDTWNAWSRHLYYIDATVYRLRSYDKAEGFGLRCVRDIGATQINENIIDKYIQIYPNPATDKVYINITEGQKIKMQVYNIIGNCVLQSELTNETNDIDISFLATGVYVIKLTGADGTIQRKLIKG